MAAGCTAKMSPRSLEAEKRRAEYRRRYQLAHSEELAEKKRRYRLEHGDRVRQQDRDWRLAHLEQSRAADARYSAKNRPIRGLLRANYYAMNARRRKYGITLKAFEELLVAQSSRCDCCGEELAADRSRIAVDHDHTTGRFRGLLCLRCNIDVGRYELHHERVARYLAKHAAAEQVTDARR